MAAELIITAPYCTAASCSVGPHKVYTSLVAKLSPAKCQTMQTTQHIQIEMVDFLTSLKYLILLKLACNYIEFVANVTMMESDLDCALSKRSRSFSLSSACCQTSTPFLSASEYPPLSAEKNYCNCSCTHND